jgi:lysophospholipase
MAGLVRTDLVDTPANPVPHASSCVAVRAADGIGLRLASFPAMAGAIWGTLLVLQGRAEFVEKYFETISHFRRRGFDVVGFDWRGQGGSERLTRNPRKGHVRHFLDYQLDLDAVFRQMQESGRPKPWFVVAHSMGAAILLERLRRGPVPLLRAAILSPMIGLSEDIAPAYARTAVSTLSWLGPRRVFVPGGGPRSISTLPFENNRLSSDPFRYERNAAILSAAPDLGIGAPTIGWLASAFKTMGALSNPNFPRKLTTPLLIVASGADRVVETLATQRFASRLKTGEAIIIKGARHELLMESDTYREQVLAALDVFIPGGDWFGRGTANAATSA